MNLSIKNAAAKFVRALFICGAICLPVGGSAWAQDSSDPNDIFPPEIYEMLKEDMVLQMESAYGHGYPLSDLVSLQVRLISEVAMAVSLPDYLGLQEEVAREFACQIESSNCEEVTCVGCSRQRVNFYRFLKTKVFMNERTLYSVGYQIEWVEQGDQ